MNLRGVLLVWIGLMGVAATAAVFLLLRLFPRVFSGTGPSVVWPWRRDAAKSARARGGLLLVVAVGSVLVAVVGIISLLS